MAFDDLPALPPMLHAGAAGYARRALAATAEVMGRHRVLADQPYGGDYWQKVDVYLPDAPPGPLPVLLYFHGGAWMNGYKEWMGYLAPPVLAMPAVFVSASYRLAPSVGMSEIVDDCVAALRWVHQHSAALGGDPGRIAVGGHSAGGHLAAVLALRPDLCRAAGLPGDVVKACLPSSAPLDLDFLQWPAAEADRRMREALGGGLDAWSPARHVAGNAVPFHLAWGEHDFARTREQNQAFARALAAQPGARVSWQVLPGDHFTSHEACADPASEWPRAAGLLLSTLTTGKPQ
ncbi:alpha/beta hydrolase [Pigmentiphaga sp. D-2]|uniref:alpha/beta hydrolase n=1 Tax=Pigmentiphaga sp. D-2 TaxID=1002116 RepID=UPI0010495277|nr:alpha/beta hydrolase [Pigmentiphaga sp. D-2]